MSRTEVLDCWVGVLDALTPVNLNAALLSGSVERSFSSWAIGTIPAMAITEITRQAIIDDLRLGKFRWAGRLEEPDFLSRLYRLDQLPSYDRRFADAAGDIWQHRENNLDWEDDWVFTDDRFELAHNDEKFLQFLAATVHPTVHPDQHQARQLVEIYNRHLSPDGWELAEVTQISGRPCGCRIGHPRR